MFAKSIIVDLSTNETSLIGYDIWHKKVQFLLEDKKVLETLNDVMMEPSDGLAQQVRCEVDTYRVCKRKNYVA